MSPREPAAILSGTGVKRRQRWYAVSSAPDVLRDWSLPALSALRRRQ